MTHSLTDTLASTLAEAYAARRDMANARAAENTDAWRLFHGSAEGWPGLTIDRYGDVLLAQSFHHPLDPASLALLRDFYATALPGTALIYNDRSGTHSRIANPLRPDELAAAMETRVVHELGVAYSFQARHAGQDPWLFLDLRAARRRLMQEAPGKSLLNLFAYTCGVGTAAAKAGAAFVVNVDFSETALAVGKENARLNELPHRPRFIKSDAFAAMRQLSGTGQPTRVRGRTMPPFPKLEPRRFDLVFLDPPRYAKSAFGVVDLIHDYASVFKPAVLCVAEGGALFACNNVAEVERDAWLDQLQRTAAKAGRPIKNAEWITPDADFPTTDGNPPLKTVFLRF